MAKENKDKYSKINGVINETVEYCLGYILKFPSQIAESIQSKGGIGSITEKKFSIPNSKNGNISLLQDLSILTQKAIDEYVRLYDKGLKNSKTWMSQSVLTKPQSACQIDFNVKEINEFIDKSALADDTDNKNFKNIKNFIAILNDAFGKQNVSKLSNAKFYKHIKDLKSKLSSVIIEKIEDAEISEIPESIKTPVCISNDGSIGEKSSMVDGRDLDDILNCLSSEDNKSLMIKAKEDAEHKEELSDNDKKLLIDLIRKNKNTYTEWVEKNKNNKDKESVINALNEMTKENDNTESEVDTPKNVQDAVNKIAKETVAVDDKSENPKETSNRFNKLKADLENTKKIIEAWFNDKQTNANGRRKRREAFFNFKKLFGNVFEHIIPQAWTYTTVALSKDMGIIEHLIQQEQFLQFLNEDDMTAEKEQSEQPSNDSNEAETKNDATDNQEENIKIVKEKIDAVDDILKTKNPNEVKSKYEKWIKEIGDILNKATENEKLKEKMTGLQDKDPYEQICLFYGILNTKEDTNDENTDTNSDVNKDSSNNPNENNSVSDSFHCKFQNYLKECGGTNI